MLTKIQNVYYNENDTKCIKKSNQKSRQKRLQKFYIKKEKKVNDQNALKVINMPKSRANKNKSTKELLKELSHLCKIIENRLKKL